MPDLNKKNQIVFSDIEKTEFASKAKAIKAIAQLGWVDHFDTGESGDHGYGSRLYFKKKTSKTRTTFHGGIIFAEQATVSRVGRTWRVSIFENMNIGE